MASSTLIAEELGWTVTSLAAGPYSGLQMGDIGFHFLALIAWWGTFMTVLEGHVWNYLGDHEVQKLCNKM